MSLTSTILNSITYQSYASVAEANEGLAVDLERVDDWDDLDDTEKGRMLVAATRRLDALNWAGSKAESTQATEWPRVNIQPEPSAPIPPELERATILLAGDLAGDTSGESAVELDDSVIASESVGPMSVSYGRRSKVRARGIGGQSAHSLIAQWLEARGVVAPVVSGTDGESSFVPLDRYGRTEGIG